MAKKAVAVEKKRLVAAVKDINKVLDLDTPLPTKGSEDEIIEAILEEGKADDGGFFEQDELEQDTFDVLEQLGVEIQAGSADEDEPEEKKVTKKAAAKKKAAPAKAKNGNGKKPATKKAPAKEKPAAKKPPAKKPAAKKPAAKKKNGKKISCPDEGVIKFLVDENPHRKGTKAYDRFKLMKDGMKIATYIKKGGARSAVYHHARNGYIKVVV